MKSSKLLRTLLLLVIAGVAVTGVVDDVSKDYAESALTRALTTYAIARTLNGVISVAQGTEIALEPGGVGIVTTPGQILDPINDLIERFSSVLLVAASSLGLQLVLLEILSWIGITLLLIVALAVWLAATWSDGLKRNRYVVATLRLALMLVFVRFAVPVVIICTNIVFGAFMLEKHDSAAAELQATSEQVEELNRESDEAATSDAAGLEGIDPPADEASATLLDRLRSAYERLPDAADVSTWFGDISISRKLAQLEESAANATGNIVNLIVIFVLQTILLPLGFLWIFFEALKTAAARAFAVFGARES